MLCGPVVPFLRYLLCAKLLHSLKKRFKHVSVLGKLKQLENENYFLLFLSFQLPSGF